MTDTLNVIADRTDRILLRWIEQDELFHKTNGKEGKELLPVQANVIMRRLKDCDIQTPDIDGGVLGRLREKVPSLKLHDEMPPLSLEGDAATA